jgi:hypothetical protein
VAMNQCIDTYLTRLFYRKYKIDETYIPEADDDIINIPSMSNSLIEEPEVVEEDVTEDEGLLFEDDEIDPNY